MHSSQKTCCERTRDNTNDDDQRDVGNFRETTSMDMMFPALIHPLTIDGQMQPGGVIGTISCISANTPNRSIHVLRIISTIRTTLLGDDGSISMRSEGGVDIVALSIVECSAIHESIERFSHSVVAAGRVMRLHRSVSHR